MFGRKILMVGALGAAVGGPYVATEWPAIKSKFAGSGTSAAAPVSPGAATVGHYGTTPYAGRTPVPSSSASPLATPEPAGPRLLLPGESPQGNKIPTVDLAEALNFGATPQWIISRWPRVSAGIPGDSLHGMRVALISGVREDDVAGALTYYFTSGQKCAKITFSGTTGDPRRLINLAIERFGFKAFGSSEPGVTRYEIRWNGKPHSELIIRPVHVVRSSSPLARYEVQLLVVDPSRI